MMMYYNAKSGICKWVLQVFLPETIVFYEFLLKARAEGWILRVTGGKMCLLLKLLI
jgi:hypothetical protein